MRPYSRNSPQAAARIVALAAGPVAEGEATLHGAAVEQWRQHRWTLPPELAKRSVEYV